jgi:uncharacterized DUF497 family protein
MIIPLLLQATGFEWDEHNTPKNRDKHQVKPGECEELFFNEPLLIVEDKKHSGIEARFHALGTSDSGRRMLAVFTLRGKKIQVVSVRDMSRKERVIYDSK